MAFRSLLSGSLPLLAASACLPGMFWVNYLNSPDSMAVSWTAPCAPSTPLVRFGTSPSSLTSTATPNVTSYTFPETGYTSPFIMHATLTGLSADTQYFYTVGDAASGVFAGVMNFTSHPGEGLSSSGPVTFAVIGDLGQTSNSVDTLAHVAANPSLRALIHAGDLSYADNDEPRWDSWQNLTAPVSQYLPWMTVVGNHEIELDTNLKTFEAYTARWMMPAINYGTPTQSSQLFYSFRVSGVHFLMLSSYSDFSASSLQMAWLTAELASVDRTLTPWLVAVLHAPWYNSNNAHQGDGESMRQAFEAMLYAAKVDLVLAGHVHAYERCFRSYNLAPNPAGSYYITIGDGGNREGLASSWISPQPAYSAFRQASYGHGELTILNATVAHWTWHQNPDLEPTIADELYIVRGASEEAQEHVTAEPRFRRRA